MNTHRRILIVDDDPDIHVLLASAIAAPEREIESAYEGIEALRLIEQSHFDLIMTDVIMPGMDGLMLLERIRELRPETRVVVMTAVSTPERVIGSISEKAFAYFSKPFTIEVVSDMVSRALSTIPGDDDIEVLSARPNWLELRLRCKTETAERILHFLKELGMDVPAPEQEKIAMAFREILINAVEHGGGFDPEKKVTITYVRAERAILYYVRDPGKGFSFQDLSHAATANPHDLPFQHTEVREKLGIRPGGFGIFMTRKLVDEVIYNQAGNEVLLIQYLSGNTE